MKEYIKSNNLQGFSNTIKTYSVLPASGRADEVAILKNDGVYQYKNNQWNKLLNTGVVSGAAVPLGIIKPSTTVLNDSDWLLCDGSVYDTSAYPELYNLLGANTLPDLRDYYLVGQGQNDTDAITEHDSEAACPIRTSHNEIFQSHSHANSNMCHNHPFYADWAILCEDNGETSQVFTYNTGSHFHGTVLYDFCFSIEYGILCYSCAYTSNIGSYAAPVGCIFKTGVQRYTYSENTSGAATLCLCSSASGAKTINALNNNTGNIFKYYTVNFYIKAR